MPKKTKHQFTLTLGGVRAVTPELEEALYAAGCDDALLGQSEGAVFLDFTRSAPSFAKAVLSALRDTRKIGRGVRVLRVGPDDLVTAADIAHRAGRSRESVRQLIHGLRGPGDFPPPVASLRKSRLWRWGEVADWLVRRGYLKRQAADPATYATIACLNDALDLVRYQREPDAVHNLVGEVLRLYGEDEGTAPRRAQA